MALIYNTISFDNPIYIKTGFGKILKGIDHESPSRKILASAFGGLINNRRLYGTCLTGSNFTYLW